jgi:peptide/nickel transport system ATP-binding protein
LVGWIKAVDGVSFSIPEGHTSVLVGESGCGKITTGRFILRALRPTGGEILFRRDGSTVDIVPLDEKELR